MRSTMVALKRGRRGESAAQPDFSTSQSVAYQSVAYQSVAYQSVA